MHASVYLYVRLHKIQNHKNPNNHKNHTTPDKIILEIPRHALGLRLVNDELAVRNSGQRLGRSTVRLADSSGLLPATETVSPPKQIKNQNFSFFQFLFCWVEQNVQRVKKTKILKTGSGHACFGPCFSVFCP